MLLAPGKYHKNFQSSRFHAGVLTRGAISFFCLKYVLFTMVSVIAQESAHAQSKASVLRSHICIWIHRGGVTCVHNRRQAPKHPHNFRSTLGPVQKRPRIFTSPRLSHRLVSVKKKIKKKKELLLFGLVASLFALF